MKRKDLEAQRNKITEFFNCLQEQVSAGIITREMAREIAHHEYGNKTYAQLISEIDRELALLPTPSPRRTRNVHLTVLAVVVVLGIGFAWQSGQLTGLFTFGDEEFYNYDFTTEYANDDIAVLALEENMSSLRVNGEISGTGTARLWLQSGTEQYLLAEFDPEDEASLLTGLFTAASDIIGADDSADDNSSNVTEELGAVIPEADEEAAADIIDEIVPEEPTPAEDPIETPVEEAPLVPSVPVIEEPAPAVEEPIPVFAVKNLDNVCIESCSIPNATAPFMLIVDIDGEATVRIDSFVYGVRPIEAEPELEVPVVELPPEEPLEEEPVEEILDPGAPRPDEEVASGLSTGELCGQGSDCASGICKADRFQGTSVARRCVPRQDYCVETNTAVAPGSSVADSICYAADESIWLAAPGNGRHEIENRQGQLIAVVDKYGNMAVVGDASFSTQVDAIGWMMQNANGAPTVSIDSRGNINAVESLVERTTPVATAGNDFIVKDGDGTVQAVFTESGSVQLAGVFSSNAALR